MFNPIRPSGRRRIILADVYAGRPRPEARLSARIQKKIET
jgi:hypothetical protein